MKHLGIMKDAQKSPENAAKIAEEPRRASATIDLPNSTLTGLEIPPGAKYATIRIPPITSQGECYPD